EDDNFDIALSGIHSTNPPEINGGSGAESRSALIRDGRDTSVNPNKRPYFVPAVAPADGIQNSIGDQLFLDDSSFAARDADYSLSGVQAFRIGDSQPLVKYQNIELLNLTTGRGNNDVTTNMNAGPLPNIVQIVTSDPLDSDNRFQVEGSAAADKISIGDIGTTLVTSGGQLRAHFELAGFERLWVRGNAGADIIDNISKVPGVLD